MIGGQKCGQTNLLTLSKRPANFYDPLELETGAHWSSLELRTSVLIHCQRARLSASRRRNLHYLQCKWLLIIAIIIIVIIAVS